MRRADKVGSNSRKGAKAQGLQKTHALNRGRLCALAPLRELCFGVSPDAYRGFM